jgi:CRP/FNR family transcriptional regulator, cyclic AMP receptor protein
LETQTVRLLEYEPELGQTLRSEQRAEAFAGALATMVKLPCGDWDPATLVHDRKALYGLLLLDGLVSRTIVVDDVAAVQLLGRGDLVLPYEPAETLVETAVRWGVREPSPVALLDAAFLLRVRRWPELVAALFQRIATQSNRRAIYSALSQLPRVEDRIHALLWFLAERWGRVTPLGVILPMRFTHELLGRLVGAKRPTVSLALKALEADDRVHRRPDGSWLLARAWDASPVRDDGRASDIRLLEPPGARPAPAARGTPGARQVGADALAVG